METLHLRKWSNADVACSPSELPILQHWTPLPSPQTSPLPSPTSPPRRPSRWDPPPEDFIKINFDGASKGNPGPARYGVVFRNHNGKILVTGAGSLGYTTNNVAELWGLINGLQMAIQNNFQKLIVEGDSQVIIDLLGKILNGANLDSISPSWRLSHGL